MAFDRSFVRGPLSSFSLSRDSAERRTICAKEKREIDERGTVFFFGRRNERRPEGWRGSTEGRAEEKSRRKKGGRKGEKKRSGSFTSVRIKRSSASIIINQDVNNEGTDGSESGRARCGRDTRSLAIESVGFVRCVAAFRRRYATVCISARTAPHRAAPHTAVRGS